MNRKKERKKERKKPGEGGIMRTQDYIEREKKDNDTDNTEVYT